MLITTCLSICQASNFKDLGSDLRILDLHWLDRKVIIHIDALGNIFRHAQNAWSAGVHCITDVYIWEFVLEGHHLLRVG